MLMKTEVFLSAKDLGLIEQYYQGLCRVLTMLEREEFANITVSETNKLLDTYLLLSDDDPLNPANKKYFTMSVGRFYTNCGTIACIMGWAVLFAELTDDVIRARGEGGRRDECELYLKTITHTQITNHSILVRPIGWRTHNYSQKEAACALRSYLETGIPVWSA